MSKRLVLCAFLLGVVLLAQANEKNSLHETYAQAVADHELEQFIQLLHKKGGFFDRMSALFRREGYYYQTMGMVNSTKDIRVMVIIPDNEEITEQKVEGIKRILYDLINEFEWDIHAFDIQVGYSDEFS